MLKKTICVILHIVASVVICVALLIGALRWGDLGARPDVLMEMDTYEYSGMCWLDAMNDAPMLWEYLDTQRFLYGFNDSYDYPSMGYIEEVYDASVLDEAEDDTVSYRISLEPVYDSLVSNLRYWSDVYAPDNSNLKYKLYYDGSFVTDNVEQEHTDSLLKVYEDQNDAGYSLQIYLDTNYPADDYFKERATSYNDFQHLKKILILISACMFVVWMAATIMLSVFCGRDKSQQGVVLSWVDRPPLELVLLFWTVIAACVVIAVVYSASNSYYEASYIWLVISGAVVALGDSLALTGYLSLVRRIKSHTLWKNSLCYRIAMGAKQIARNLLSLTNVSQRIVTISSLYIVCMLLLCLLHTSAALWIAVLVSVGALVFVYRDAVSRMNVLEGMRKITKGELDHRIDLDEVNVFQMEMAEAINQVGTAIQQAVNQSMKDEHLKADLITNVSHDIKTPLTSIINYVDLLKREDMPNQKVQGYLEILDQKSQRLKQLTEDLVEASKLSSGNVVLDMQKMDFNEILIQSLGEFEEKFTEKNLQVILKKPDGQVLVLGEGRRIWRILENLFQNIYKYAMPGTRVYAELVKNSTEMILTLKNISQHPLNVDADELTERFIRGDVSRTTEGSGLGLSIARDLTTLQKGTFDICLDGDLFKVTLTFALILEGENK